MNKTNPTVLLNGDQIYLDALIRENARLTVQHEADRQILEQMRGEVENMISVELHQVEVERLRVREEKLTADMYELKTLFEQAVEDLHKVMAGYNPCDVCLNKCPMGATKCTPAWRGSRGQQ